MKRHFLRVPPEWVVAVVLALVAIAFSVAIHAPFCLPSFGSLLFIGLTYLLPFIFISIWILLPLPFLIYRGELKTAAWLAFEQAGYAFCLGAVMLLEFHIKLWVPFINPRTYDLFYEATDRACLFWLDPMFAWRGQLHSDFVDQLYFRLFMFMFVVSFIVHHVRGAGEFRRVFLASILVQAFGGVSYLIAPALGPFIFHAGVNAHVTGVEQHLLTIHRELVAGGTVWLQDHASDNIAGGLGAMPSLHVAASFVFVYYAQKYCTWLACIYWPIFSWIVFEAMASRWHYGIDLLAGFALSWGCIVLANRWIKARETTGEPKVELEENLAITEGAS